MIHSTRRRNIYRLYIKFEYELFPRSRTGIELELLKLVLIAIKADGCVDSHLYKPQSIVNSFSLTGARTNMIIWHRECSRA